MSINNYIYSEIFYAKRVAIDTKSKVYDSFYSNVHSISINLHSNNNNCLAISIKILAKSKDVHAKRIIVDTKSEVCGSISIKIYSISITYE
jgi:hypothetical protein